MTYIRKTRDYWAIEQNCGYGWEEVCAEDTWKDARAQLKCYRENQPEYPVRARKKRERIDEYRRRDTAEYEDSCFGFWDYMREDRDHRGLPASNQGQHNYAEDTMTIQDTRPERRVFLTGKQVLARMRKGDCPTQSGAGTSSAIFDDSAIARGVVMKRLIKAGLIDYPQYTSVYSRFRLR